MFAFLVVLDELKLDLVDELPVVDEGVEHARDAVVGGVKVPRRLRLEAAAEGVAEDAPQGEGRREVGHGADEPPPEHLAGPLKKQSKLRVN